MPKPRIDYFAARRFILVMMYDAFIQDHRMEFDTSRVRKQLPMPTNLIKVSFERLEDDGLVSEVTKQRTRPAGLLGGAPTQEWVGTNAYELTDEGRSHVEKLSDEIYDLSLAALANGAAASVYQAPSAPSLPPRLQRGAC